MEVTLTALAYSLPVLFAIIIAKWFYRRLRDSRNYTYPPGPKGWPLVGNTFNVPMTNLHRAIWDHKDKFGDLSYVSIGGNNIVFVNSFDAFTNIMAHPAYRKILSGRMTSFLSQYYLPDDLNLASYGEKWAKLRKLVHTIITPYSRDIHKIEVVIREEFRMLKQKLETLQDVSFDISKLLSTSTGNIMVTLLVGERFDYDHEIHKLLHDINNQIDQLCGNFNIGVLTACPLLRYIPLGPGRMYQNVMKTLAKIMYHLRRHVDEKATRKGILYEMLNKQGELGWLSDGNIHDLLVDILVAGITTTSKTMYILLLIMIHKADVQKRMQDEIDSVVGREREPTLNDKANMPYVRAAIFEALRYSTFIPVVGAHTAMEDFEVNGFVFKKNTAFMANIWRMNHDDQAWNEPWEFKPERYLDSAGNLVPPEHDARKNVTMFGVGLRRCIGEMFALNRLFLFFTHMCQRFTFFADDAEGLPSMDPREWKVESFVLPKPYKLRLAVRT